MPGDRSTAVTIPADNAQVVVVGDVDGFILAHCKTYGVIEEIGVPRHTAGLGGYQVTRKCLNIAGKADAAQVTGVHQVDHTLASDCQTADLTEASCGPRAIRLPPSVTGKNAECVLGGAPDDAGIPLEFTLPSVTV